jgi:peptide/nickel transport system permease protein
MASFILRRLLAAIPLVIAVSLLTHLLIEWAPGDVTSELATDPSISREELAQLRARFHLDEGPLRRYVAWLGQAVQGNLGRAANGQPVAEQIGERVFNTLVLSMAALLVAWVLGIPLGILAAVKRGTWVDRGSGLVMYAFLSLPAVFFSLMLLCLAARTHWFPIGGMTSLGYESMSFGARARDLLQHLLLPSLVLGLGAMAHYARQARGSMIDVLGRDYLRTARAKGLSEGRVVFKHALRNALNPLVSLAGQSIGALLNGSFLVEYVFAWPGLARLTFDGMQRQDEFVVKAAVTMAAIMLLIGNTIGDLLLAAVDPRVRVA